MRVQRKLVAHQVLDAMGIGNQNIQRIDQLWIAFGCAFAGALGDKLDMELVAAEPGQDLIGHRFELGQNIFNHQPFINFTPSPPALLLTTKESQNLI